MPSFYGDASELSELKRLELLLRLVIDAGEPIHGPCYPGGNVLHAILNNDSYKSTGYRCAKSVVASRAGADHEALRDGKSLLSCARWLRAKLVLKKKTGRFGNKGRVRLLEFEIEDVNNIIRISDDHRKRGHWKRRDDYYIKRMEVDW